MLIEEMGRGNLNTENPNMFGLGLGLGLGPFGVSFGCFGSFGKS